MKYKLHLKVTKGPFSRANQTIIEEARDPIRAEAAVKIRARQQYPNFLVTITAVTDMSGANARSGGVE